MAIERPRIGRRLIPLLDVLFLLLAFFIVMPHGMRSVQQRLATPPDWQAEEIERLIEMRVDDQGLVRIGRNAYTLAELSRSETVLPRAHEKAMVLLKIAWDAKIRDARALRRLLDERQVVYVVLQEGRK